MSQLITQRRLSRFFSFVVAATLIGFQLHTTQVFADANETATTSLYAKASASLSIGRFSTCAITNVGAVNCWGRDDVAYRNVLVPTQVPTLTSGAVAITSTDDINCVLLNTGGVKCWGPNWLGLLGDLTTTNSATPVDVYGLTSGVKAISGGHDHICALLIAGTVKCWGSNNAFQLGIPTMGQTTTGYPTAVPNLTGVTAISAGGYHTCALLDTGTLKCWGNNGQGQLGIDSWSDSRSPVDVQLYGTIFVSVTTGDWHTCALTVNNKAYCWGKNYNSQLGIATDGYYNRMVPTLVTITTTTISALSAGDIHTCAVLTTGVVKCWGPNWIDGRLGASDITNAIAVTAGESHSCAVLATGAVKCWGDNDYGQLGNGTTTETWSAVQATGLTNNVGVPTTTTTTTTTLAPTTTSTTTTTTTLAPTTTSTSTTTTVPTTTSTSSTTTSSSSVPSSVTTTTTTSTPVSAVSPPTTTTLQPQSAVATIAPASPVAEPSPMAAVPPSTTTTAPASVVVPSPTTTSTSSPTRTSTTTTTPTETRTDGITPGDTKSIATVMANSPSNRIIVFVDGEKTDALIRNTDRKVTVSVAGAKIVLSATAPDGTMINVDSDGVLEVKPGSTVSTASTGFAAYSPVETWCYCTPTQLGSDTTNGIGATQAAYPLPTAVTTGSHHLVVEGANARKQSITIGFAMRVTNTSVFSRIISNPLAWFFLVIFSLIGLLLPARIRRRSESTT